VSLPDFRLEVYLGKWEFSARHHLTASDAQTLTIAEVLGPEGLEELARLPLRYSPTWGTDALRAAIAATYQTVAPDDVLVFAGAEEAMFWALQELVGPGDHAIVTVPNYQSTESLPQATGAAVSGLTLRPEDGWAVDLDALSALIRPNTRLLAVNFPNNPTGALPDRATWAALIALCEERGIRLFSDEVYRGLEPDGTPRLRQAADASPTALSLGVMSKAYGLPGLRIGWLACRDRAVLERLETRKHYTSICSASPSELIATHALRRGDELTARNRRSSPATCRSSTPSSPPTPSCSRGSTRRPAASASRATSAPTASRRSAATWSSRPASCCCPPRSTRPSWATSPPTGSGSASGEPTRSRRWRRSGRGWLSGGRAPPRSADSGDLALLVGRPMADPADAVRAHGPGRELAQRQPEEVLLGRHAYDLHAPVRGVPPVSPPSLLHLPGGSAGSAAA
jgi:hypothetical protein